jgi:hypothetical protein
VDRDAVHHHFIFYRKIGTGGGAKAEFGIDKGYGTADIAAFRFHEVRYRVEDRNELASCGDHFEDRGLEKEKVFCSGHQVTWGCEPGGGGAQLIGIKKTKVVTQEDRGMARQVGGGRVMSPGVNRPKKNLRIGARFEDTVDRSAPLRDHLHVKRKRYSPLAGTLGAQKSSLAAHTKSHYRGKTVETALLLYSKFKNIQ